MIHPTITTSVPELGADILQIGTDGDLSRLPGAIVRYRSQSFDGVTHTDFHALALGSFQALALASELQEPGSSGLAPDGRSELIERLYALAAHDRDAREVPERPAMARQRVTMDDLSDPDIVGAGEYRAIYELLVDATSGIHDSDDWREIALGVLGETISYASQLIVRIADAPAVGR